MECYINSRETEARSQIDYLALESFIEKGKKIDGYDNQQNASHFIWTREYVL